ncbi:MAG: 3-isopropylmalate dehydratase small subunit [Betaproteobacteria bacterium]
MDKFVNLTAIAAPLLQKNIDTDLIIRIERCTGTPKHELGQYAFEMVRFLPGGGENPDFVLNQPRYRGAQILLCGEFFGTGSSREVAVWALANFGVRCLIAPSFGQIFYNNCFQNGLLAIVLPAPVIEELANKASKSNAEPFTVDLEKQTINGTIKFDVSPRNRKMLLEGLDEIGLTLAMEPKIAAFQAADRKRRPWIYA